MESDYSRYFSASMVNRGAGTSQLLITDEPLEDLINGTIKKTLRTFVHDRWEHIVGVEGLNGESVDEFTDRVIHKVIDSLERYGEVQVCAGNLGVNNKINENFPSRAFEASKVIE